MKGGIQKKLPVPKKFNRAKRTVKNANGTRRNDGSKIGGGFAIGVGGWDGQAVFKPRNKKWKGWQRELQRRTGKKRRA